MSIDVSTHQLAETTCNALGGKISLDDVLVVWHGLGKLVKAQLLKFKGVRLSSFGTFSITSKGEPGFLISGDLASQFRLKQKYPPSFSNVPTAALNLAQLAQEINVTREIVDKIYAKYISCLGKIVFEGRSILLTVYRVAEVTIANGEVSCSFIPEFLKNFANQEEIAKSPTKPTNYREVANKTAIQAAKTQTIQNRRSSREQPPFQIGGDSYDQPKARAQSAKRDRNPLIGDQFSQASSARPSSAMRGRGDMRRPSSAQSFGSISTSSLMHTPPSQASGYSLNQRGGGGGGLRREQLERFNQMNNRAPAGRSSGMTDPRAIAAKALSNGGDIVAKVRRRIIERGGSCGIRSLTKLLAIMDDNGDKRLSKDEFKFGLRDYGIDLTPTELEQVFQYFDRDGNGAIDVTEFLVGIRGDMSERRKAMVRMAFDVLDKDRSGEITVDEIVSVYDFNWHPEVRAGKKTIKEAAKDFMNQWDRVNKDGIVTVEEFEDYYKEISASIDDDDYFELMIRNAWRIAGGSGAAANTANRRVLVTNKDGTQGVQTINDELGMRAGDKDDMRRRLAKQGISADSIELYGGLDTTEKARNARGAPAGGHRNDRQDPRTGGRPQNNHGQQRHGHQQQQQRPQAKYAWPEMIPDMGDQHMPPGGDDYNYPASSDSRRAATGSRSSREQGKASLYPTGQFNPYDVLQKQLYTPPQSLEQLCAKLQVSSVNTNPRIARGAFMSRMAVLDSNLSREQLRELWKAVDPDNQGTVEANAIHNLLSSRFGKDKTSFKNAGVVDRVVKKILERCGDIAGIKGLQRTLSIMDNNGDKRLTKEELKTGMADYGIDLNLRELDDVFTFFDRDHNGFVDVDEFLIGVKGDLNERRRKLVRMAFDTLDRDGSGEVSVDEMMHAYDFTKNPDVVSGKKTIKEAMHDFMRLWDKSNDGIIVYEEFEDYYKGVSASIDGDDYFELMIRNAWRIAGGEGACANTANKRVLVTNKDGTQGVQTINDELGMRAGDKDDMRRRLAKQGISADSIELYGGLDTTEKAGGKRPTGRGDPRRGSRDSGAGKGQPGRDVFNRHEAATKLAAAFRSRLARKEVEHERRKVDADRQRRQEEEAESNRPKPRQITRPKGKSYIGF